MHYGRRPWVHAGMRPLRRGDSDRRGFTLIEILVVVAIIALLVAILLPALARVRSQARLATCASNEKQIGTAMTLFATEHQSRVPRGLSRHGGTSLGEPPNWVRMVTRMFGDKKNYGPNFNLVPVENYEVYSCPERSGEYPGTFLDYVVNSMDHRGPLRISDCTPDRAAGLWYEVEGVTRLNVWDRPSEVIYVTDAVEESWDVVDQNNSFGSLKGIRENIQAVRRDPMLTRTGFDWFDVPGGKSVPAYREMLDPAPGAPRKPRASLQMHLARGSNGIFVDGHVELVKPPRSSVGAQKVLEFYLAKFGVDPKIVPGCTVLETTAIIDECAAGDLTWRP